SAPPALNALVFLSPGLRQITLTNTWYSYGALQRLLASSSAVIKDAAVSDGGQSLVSNYEEISTSVRYRLRHRVQLSLGGVGAFGVQNVNIWAQNFFLCFSPEGVGGWSTRGCSVSSSQKDLTTCACNHTTNFAVLLQVYEVQRSLEEESTLKTLTFVGCGVSFCALIVTFVLFLAVGVPKSERTTVHKNLIFALAAAEALLMFSELAKINQGVCFAVTAFLHLFFMAAFAWMLVEGLLLWSKVVAVNMSEDRRMRFYYVTGWGLPVLIVGVTLATSFNKYVADNHCWLNVQTEVIWAFVGPVLFVLTTLACNFNVPVVLASLNKVINLTISPLHPSSIAGCLSLAPQVSPTSRGASTKIVFLSPIWHQWG
ncbi:hypothetical protein Chor_004302, partial [Crotalus horridus]